MRTCLLLVLNFVMITHLHLTRGNNANSPTRHYAGKMLRSIQRILAGDAMPTIGKTGGRTGGQTGGPTDGPTRRMTGAGTGRRHGAARSRHVPFVTATAPHGHRPCPASELPILSLSAPRD